MKTQLALMLTALALLMFAPGCITSKERTKFDALKSQTQLIAQRLVEWGQYVKDTDPPADSRQRVADTHETYLLAVEDYYRNVEPDADFESYETQHNAAMAAGAELLRTLSMEMQL